MSQFSRGSWTENIAQISFLASSSPVYVGRGERGRRPPLLPPSHNLESANSAIFFLATYIFFFWTPDTFYAEKRYLLFSHRALILFYFYLDLSPYKNLTAVFYLDLSFLQNLSAVFYLDPALLLNLNAVFYLDPALLLNPATVLN